MIRSGLARIGATAPQSTRLITAGTAVNAVRSKHTLPDLPYDFGVSTNAGRDDRSLILSILLNLV